MKIATWNVNGLRAREAQLLAWLALERPDIVCLQEIKASADQLSFALRDLDGYWADWHGEKGYSGVGLLVSKALAPQAPVFTHPAFDFEQRITITSLPAPGGSITVASVYVPNGGKDYPKKLRFLEGLGDWAGELAVAGQPLVLCGDLNVTRSDLDIHPKERKPNQVGTRADERGLLEALLAHQLVDVARAREPENAELFTWWAPWRSLRQRNIGWRIDYIVASDALYETVTSAAVQREVGTSDHAPLIVEFAI
jgi:exodeoxyribonuclease III